VLVPDASNSFFAGIARKVMFYAERQGLLTLMADSHDSLEHEKDLLAHFQSRRVEGLIVCPIGGASDRWRELKRSGAKVVVVDRWFADIKLPTVTSEHEQGAFAATSAMIGSGHRRIGCLQGRMGTSVNDERLNGFYGALHAHNIRPKESLIRGDGFSEDSGYRSTCELLDAHPDLTGLFAFSNQNALGALRAFGERKLKVPKDISLVVFDDAPFAEYLASPLSVIRQDVEAIGRAAAELLIEQIRSDSKPRQLLRRVPVEFVRRESIGPPRKT
jgi:LacI family transcriptional regulator